MRFLSRRFDGARSHLPDALDRAVRSHAAFDQKTRGDRTAPPQPGTAMDKHASSIH
jgi:hypothetical protein